MGEIRFYRQEIQVGYSCDKCKNGYVYPNGYVSDNWEFGAMFGHTCEKCRTEVELPKVYPATEVEFVKKEMK